jgi:hypothetical protein
MGFAPPCQRDFTLPRTVANLWDYSQVNQPWTLAGEIRRRMSERGINAKRLSIAAGLNEGYVRDIIKARTLSPRTDSLGKLARALGCSRSDLLPPAERAAEAKEGGTRLDPALLNRALAVAERLSASQARSLQLFTG